MKIVSYRGKEVRLTEAHFFAFKLKVLYEDDCWGWTGSFMGSVERPLLYLGDRVQLYAHVFIWLWMNGDIPEDMYVLHTCDNPECVNPDHLWLGTLSDNTRDSVRKNRHYFTRMALAEYA